MLDIQRQKETWYLPTKNLQSGCVVGWGGAVRVQKMNVMTHNGHTEYCGGRVPVSLTLRGINFKGAFTQANDTPLKN